MSETQPIPVIEVVLRCLVDTSKPELRQMVLQRLLNLMPFGYHPMIYIENVSDPACRIQLREQYGSFLNETKLRHDLKRIIQRNSGDIDLEMGAFLISRLGLDDYTTPEEFRRDLDHLAGPLRDTLACIPENNHRLKLDAFRKYVFGDLGFHGNTAQYGDPRNSFITEVIKSRTGIPISLSVLCLLLAARVHLPLSGVNMPGHFILKYSADEFSIFMDPFNDGNLLTDQDCFQILTRQGLEPSAGYLSRASSMTIVKRMYRNLINYHSRAGNTRMEKILRQHFSILENSSAPS